MLRVRFVEHVLRRGLVRDGQRLIVACSAGLDSTVLLHLLRFSSGLPRLELVAAHFDHRMRPRSDADARWLAGLARSWDVPLVTGVADRPIESELEARRARYEFLRAAGASTGAGALLTAHHADDQAETVLFRLLRGSGLQGLRGIPVRGPGGLVRPLLPFCRKEIEAYAQRGRVPFREDSSNLDEGFARNVLRREILPRIETAVAPGARRSLLRLARIAARDEEAWASLLPGLLDGVGLSASTGRITVSRTAFLRHTPGVRSRMLREVARRLASPLTESGTRAALEFTRSGASGRRHALPQGLILAREFDRLVFFREEGSAVGEALEIGAPGQGYGSLTLTGRSYWVEWTESSALDAEWVEAFEIGRLAFPLRLRMWAPGDRIGMRYGSKKLKKLFAEARIPVGERGRRPVLADAHGAVLWIPGVARAATDGEADTGARIVIGVTETHSG